MKGKKNDYEIQCTCPGCGHLVLFNENEGQEVDMTKGFDSFILRYVVCPDCTTILPYAVVSPDTGGMLTQFEFNV